MNSDEVVEVLDESVVISEAALGLNGDQSSESIEVYLLTHSLLLVIVDYLSLIRL